MNIYLDKTHDLYFDKSQTTTLKGICIIGVFVHHFCQYISYPQYDLLVLLLGPSMVNIFFLIAGYTTVLNLEKKTGYNLTHFMVKRALRLYLPIMLISITYNNFLGGLLWMYIACYIAYKFLNERYRFLFIFLMNIAFILFCIFLHMGIWWYDRVITFSFGALFAIYKENTERLLNTKTVLYSVLIISSLCMCLCGVQMGKWNNFYLLFALGLSVFESIFILTLYYILHIESVLFAFVGNISYEIFFVHQLLFVLLDRVIDSHRALFAISFVVSLITGYCIKKLWDKVVEKTLTKLRIA